MDLILVLAGSALIVALGQFILARWGSSYTHRWGEQHWKDINGSNNVPEDDHYR